MISNNKLYPHNCIGLIRWTAGDGPNQIHCFGTAFLISPSLILTAAHNLVDKRGRPYENILFYPGINCHINSYAQQEISVKGMIICPKYV